MKKTRVNDNSVIRCILSDFFNVRVAIRVKVEGKRQAYLVSTLYSDVKAFLLLTIVTLSADMSIEEITRLQDDEYGTVVTENDGSDDDEADWKDAEDHSADGSAETGKDLLSAFAKAAANPDLGKSSSFGGGRTKAGSRRAFGSLYLNNLNKMAIGDDLEDEAKVKAYRKLAAWEASLQFVRDTAKNLTAS